MVAGTILPETEGSMLAIQDHVVANRNYMKFIVKDPSVTNGRYRYGCASRDTILHITSEGVLSLPKQNTQYDTTQWQKPYTRT